MNFEMDAPTMEWESDFPLLLLPLVLVVVEEEEELSAAAAEEALDLPGVDIPDSCTPLKLIKLINLF